MSTLPSLGRRGEGWFVLQLLLLAAVAACGLFLGEAWSGTVRTVTAIAGAALVVAGLSLSLLGVRDLDHSVSPLPRPVEGGELVERGVYGRLRHPIYAGVIVAAVGWGALTASVAALVLAVVLAVLLDLKARREEAWLDEAYPAYRAYAGRTRRFVPGIY